MPFSRRRSAERLLQMAKLSAETMPAPGIAAVQAKNYERILNEVAEVEALDEEHSDVLKALQERYTPEQIAAAYLARELSLRPVPEELSDAPIRPLDGRRGNDRFDRGDRNDRGDRGGRGERGDRGDRFGGERQERGPRFDGVWYSLSAGRKHRADPRWLLPLICKAGNVSKRDVGSIRILDNETRFEILTEKSGEFFQNVQDHGTGEKGLVIRQATDGGGAAPRRDDGDFKPRGFKPKGDRFGGKPSFDGPKRGGWDKPKGGKRDGEGSFKKKPRRDA